MGEMDGKLSLDPVARGAIAQKPNKLQGTRSFGREGGWMAWSLTFYK